MQAFRDQLRQELAGPVPPALWAVSTLLLALSGPLGSVENCTLAHRTLFWAMTMGGIILTGAALRAVLHGVLGWRHHMRDLPLVAAAVALIMILPVSAVAQAHVIAHGPVLDSQFRETMLFLFLTAMAIGAYSYIAAGDGAAVPTGPDAQQTEPPAAVVPRLVQRIDPAVQDDLIAITGRDHYVDILTGKGRTSLLMRFSDAVAEAAPTDGAQVHRSHWVAWSAVTGVERREGKVMLVLSNAERIPVSRSYRDLLARRGFA